MLLVSLLFLSVNVYSQLTFDKTLSFLYHSGYTVKETDIFFKDLKQGENFYVSGTFYPTVEYIIIAGSDDNDIKDIDLYIVDMDNNLLRQDNDSLSLCIISFEVAYKVDLKCIVKCYKSNFPNFPLRHWFIIAYK
jgi:hypothetical protein